MMDLIATTPKMDLAIQDITHLVEEVCAYHAIYSPLFQRREQREAAHAYLQGLLATLPRKSIEPIVLAVDAGAVRTELLAGLAPVWIDLPARLRAGARTFDEAGGTQAYFGDPARSTVGEGKRLLDALGEIVVESFLEARSLMGR